MIQNLISLNLSADDLKNIDGALDTLEKYFEALIDLAPDERRTLTKMGDKSEAFCRQTLTVLSQNLQLVPPGYDLAEAQRDLAGLDELRTRTVRLRRLIGKADDTEMALGSDIMSAALEGYALLKVSGKGAGLDALRQSISARFNRGPRTRQTPPSNAT